MYTHRKLLPCSTVKVKFVFLCGIKITYYTILDMYTNSTFCSALLVFPHELVGRKEDIVGLWNISKTAMAGAYDEEKQHALTKGAKLGLFSVWFFFPFLCLSSLSSVYDGL